MTLSKEDKVKHLKKILEYRMNPETFAPGDFIVFRDGVIPDTMCPKAGEPAIFVKYLENPMEPDETGMPYRDNDFVFGGFDDDGNYIEYTHRSHLFRKATPEEIGEK